ncbi:NUDIX hydrolase [Bradyrhizobium commune]|uniref:GDP-mannose pyrophosphatase n=1 Tax=Bradyrhizobium commune TaxID=83627 RepID=A0A7S9GYA7_9BRAD|nr:NUDIX hydrolase [Bradyrhizobium commune]QPF90298.1 NUDIX hydrolase [Bradyrhizobium commune]
MGDAFFPKILATVRIPVSPWLEVISRDVQFRKGSSAETYYAVAQPDYVIALAITPDARLLLVRQYRPAIEQFSLELPAGMLDPNEDPDTAVARELLEETGYPAQTIELIGKGSTCSSRISNTTYSFFIQTGERIPNFIEEPGVSVSSISLSELSALVLSGAFAEQGHIGVIGLAVARGLIEL